MKTILILLLSCLPLFAATTYPVISDNTNRTITGGTTNLSFLNATNQVFAGTNRFSSVVTATNAANTFAGNSATLTNLYTYGNVGVGTTTPVSKLTLTGIMEFNDATDSASRSWFISAPRGAYGDFALMQSATMNGAISSASMRLYIDPSGNVGIGSASPASTLHVVGTGLTIGTAGTAVTNYASATATINFASILAAGYEDLTITVTGAVVNDTVTLGLPATVLAGAIFNAWVSAANTVTVRCNNAGSIAVDPASATYRVGVPSH